MPPILFAKAWYTTGHVTKEEYLERGMYTQEEWDECSLNTDPAQLGDVVGLENIAEPSLVDLIQGGRCQRQRVLWMISGKPPSDEVVILPHALIFPIEKRLANFLFAQAQNPGQRIKHISTIVFSKRGGKEASHQMINKHTTSDAAGRKELKQDVPTRSAKDWKRHQSL